MFQEIELSNPKLLKKFLYFRLKNRTFSQFLQKKVFPTFWNDC